jgi:hypothetical protein
MDTEHVYYVHVCLVSRELVLCQFLQLVLMDFYCLIWSTMQSTKAKNIIRLFSLNNATGSGMALYSLLFLPV